ncbi:MAG: DUF2071 domain-containing protein [Saprospiraceae bacterium]|nr:DUF2071 domain-containing protein [Saprospiraceae bacterium]
MSFFTKKHPFAVEAYFTRSTVLTYAVPKDQLARLIPECVTLDTYDDKWGFVAIAMVQTKNLRPKGFPPFFGHNFFLIGYRVFVRYKDQRGKKLRGLYILKSETNRRRMQFLGNIFTHYQYTTTDITQTQNESDHCISSIQSNFTIQYNSTPTTELPSSSPFLDWKTARRFAGPLPFTFTYDAQKKEVMIIEGVRSNWKPQPIHVLRHQFQFIEQLNFTNIQLASAFEIQNIPYHWKKGKTELWKP